MKNKPKETRITIRLTEKEANEWKRLADLDNRSLSNFIKLIVNKSIAK